MYVGVQCCQCVVPRCPGPSCVRGGFSMIVVVDYGGGE